MSEERDDGEAIARSQGDPDAFVPVFERHFDAIHRYLRRRLGPELADELASETFVAAFDARRRYDGSPDARAWLYGIATNLLRRHLRAEERRWRAYARAAERDEAGHAETETAVAEALGSLSPEEREALLLYAWADLSYEEIAAALHVPVGTVRSRLSRARAGTRAHLAPQLERTVLDG
jgi:RNA polymerase sigma-70 factor (ECF subfamily)